MDTHQVQQLTATFEGHAQQTENGVEYWLARDLQQLLGYAEWRNFNQTAISKAKTACEVTGHAVSDHFVDVNKMIQLAKGAEREVEDLMLTRYACYLTIGKVAQTVRDCATNQQINSVVPNEEHDDAFVYYALVQNADRVAKLAGIQAVPIVNKSLFSSVRLPVPKRNEQERIATCLSSLDDLIAAQSDRLSALQAHKQGLMQQLFPVPMEANA